MPSINCSVKLFNIGSWTILRLPKEASVKLPSRGMTMVRGTINGFPFQSTLEPDGRGSHWFRVDKTMREGAKVDDGDTVALAIEATDEWLEPEIPPDFLKALTNVPPAHSLWMKITPNAKWDWVRWIRATKQPETRKRRIEVACSKLKKGTRRPCCFNRNLCTVPAVSNNWVLLDPA